MRRAVASVVLAIVAIFFSIAAHAGENAEARKLSPNDRHFIATAIENDLAELELGRLAQQKSARAEFSHFAARIIEDHTKSRQALEALAKSLGVTPPKKAGARQKSDIAKLAKATGVKFERNFTDVVVKDHERILALFEKQATRGDAPELKAYAKQMLPTLREHLKMARALTGERK